LTGTPSQIEWAERIKGRVSGEFDRVTNAFEAAAGKQAAEDRSGTRAVIAILQEKRIEVLAKESSSRRRTNS
jgi:hypothetical protein